MYLLYKRVDYTYLIQSTWIGLILDVFSYVYLDYLYMLLNSYTLLFPFLG